MHRFHLGELAIDPAAGVMAGPAGREQLDPKVMQVLVVLARQAGEVVPRQALLEQVWPGVVVGDDVVWRCIYHLRRHLRQAGGGEHHAAMVETLPKRGYRLNCERPVEVVSPGVSTAEPITPALLPRPRSRWPYVAAILLVAVAIATAWSLRRADYFWQDPMANARFTRVTDFEGVAPGVAISRDGTRMAFLANRAGRLDAWITRAGSGEFRNLTQGRVPEIDNPVRSLGFTPDAARLTVWTRVRDAAGKESIDTWGVPIDGRMPKPYVANAAEVDWSPDGQRIVYHPAAPGDPLFVGVAGQASGRQVYIAPNGVHCHFPVWSPDGRYIYYVQGRPPDDMDVWRIAAQGGEPERVTFHASRVSYPVFLDRDTLLYLATAKDGSGPWLHGMNLDRRVAHRIAPGLEQYTSLAASAKGHRLVATRTMPKTSLWRVPISERVATEADAERVLLPVAGGRAPRLGPGYLLLVSPNDGRGLLRIGTAGNGVAELWASKLGQLVAGPAIDPISQRIAFTVSERGRVRLQVMNSDGGDLRTLAANLRVRGAPAWSPDGRSIVVAAEQDQGMRLFNVPVDGAPAAPLAADYSHDAAWSPDGRFLVFNGADVGPTFAVKALSADGRPYPMPDLVLPRGAKRLVFLRGSHALVVLKGAAHDRNFWLVDLDTGHERRLTHFRSGFAIGDFDVSADGREILFDQVREESDVVQIDLARSQRSPG